MDKLPVELLDNVVAHLPQSKLARYSTVSLEWKDQIEARTFRKLIVSSDQIEEFKRIVSGSRCSAVRDLEFKIALRTLDLQSCSMVVTRAIHDLFHAISAWNTEPDQAYLAVVVDAAWARGLKASAWAIQPVLDVTSIDNIPIVPSIARLVSYEPVISDSSWVALASRLPNLEDLRAGINDKRKQDLAQHRQNRYKLAVALNELNTNNLVHFHLASRSFGFTRSFRPTSDVLLPDRVDHLSLALNRVMRSPLLNTFRIRGDVPIGPSLFHLPDEATYFPFLEVIELDLAACAPDGRRYLHGYMPRGGGGGGGAEQTANYADNDYDDPPSPVTLEDYRNHVAHQFRWITAAEHLRPLVLAAARAVALHRMPCLQGFELMARHLFDPANGVQTVGAVEYVAPGVSSPLWYNYPPSWSGVSEDQSSVTPRTHIDVPGLEGDLEIAEAWKMVRKGCEVKWENPRRGD